jgi:hypothetical protein
MRRPAGLRSPGLDGYAVAWGMVQAVAGEEELYKLFRVNAEKIYWIQGAVHEH